VTRAIHSQCGMHTRTGSKGPKARMIARFMHRRVRCPTRLLLLLPLFHLRAGRKRIFSRGGGGRDSPLSRRGKLAMSPCGVPVALSGVLSAAQENRGAFSPGTLRERGDRARSQGTLDLPMRGATVKRADFARTMRRQMRRSVRRAPPPPSPRDRQRPVFLVFGAFGARRLRERASTVCFFLFLRIEGRSLEFH